MKNISISVTDAARNFSDCINRVRYQGTTFILLKNGIAVARIVPESEPGPGRVAKGAERAVGGPKATARPGRSSSRTSQSH